MRKTSSLLLLFLLSCGFVAAKPKIAPDLNLHGTGQSVQVIIQWKGSDADAGSQLISQVGGKLLSRIQSINAGVYQLPPAAVNAIANSGLAVYVSPDRAIHRKTTTAAAVVNAPAVWKSGYNGTGIGVAIIDSGMNVNDNLGALKTLVAYSEDFTVPAGNIKVEGYGADWYGHGSMWRA